MRSSVVVHIYKAAPSVGLAFLLYFSCSSWCAVDLVHSFQRGREQVNKECGLFLGVNRSEQKINIVLDQKQ